MKNDENSKTPLEIYFSNKSLDLYKMKVILLENMKRIGSIGEVIDVKRGFARNFLIANKKALYASKEKIFGDIGVGNTAITGNIELNLG